MMHAAISPRNFYLLASQKSFCESIRTVMNHKKTKSSLTQRTNKLFNMGTSEEKKGDLAQILPHGDVCFRILLAQRLEQDLSKV